MIRTFATLAAVGTLVAVPAFAQEQKPAESPALQAPAKPGAPAGSSVTAPGASTEASKPVIVTEQQPNQLLASSFTGTDVVGADGKKIGDVNDVLFERDGSIKAYVIGVGGFLGIGAKDVALVPASFQIVSEADATQIKLRLAMTADELTKAVTFKPYKPPTPAREPRDSKRGPLGVPPSN
jgi:sporulation protein YlmC with PRC-barrel domain